MAPDAIFLSNGALVDITAIGLWLQAEWAVIRGAPFLFLAALFAAAAGLWWLINYLKKEKIENLESTVQLLRDQLSIERGRQSGFDAAISGGIDRDLAQVLFGRPSVLEAFLDLTDTQEGIELNWDVVAAGKTGQSDAKPYMVLRALGLVERLEVSDAGRTIVVASQKAIALRAQHDEFLRSSQPAPPS